MNRKEDPIVQEIVVMLLISSSSALGMVALAKLVISIVESMA